MTTLNVRRLHGAKNLRRNAPLAGISPSNLGSETEVRTIENVKGAQQVWGRAPNHYGPFFLWGYYPEIHAEVDWKESIKGIRLHLGTDARTALQRAVIPTDLARAVYLAVNHALDNPHDKHGKRDFKAERARRKVA